MKFISIQSRKFSGTAAKVLTAAAERVAVETENKKAASSESAFPGGRRWIRTTEAGSNRFTVCPLWPLGNPPIFDWSWWTDSNPRPADYKSAALPAELHQHRLSNQRLHSIADEFTFVKWKFQILLPSIDWEILVLWRRFRYNNTRPAKQGKIPENLRR